VVGVAVGFDEVAELNPVAGAQEYEVPPEAVSTTLPFVQIVVEAGETDAFGEGFTVTVTDALSVQPEALVTKTEYVMVEVGEA
jgi:hypothetical protein